MYNVRIRYAKTGLSVYLGHLEVIKMFERAFRRNKLFLDYSTGFNPQPKMAFAFPLSVGFSSEYEILDCVFQARFDLKKLLTLDLPAGFKILDAKENFDTSSLMAKLTAHRYRLYLDVNQHRATIQSFQNCDTFPWEKQTKRTTRILDMKEFVSDIKFFDEWIELNLGCSEHGSLNPESFGKALQLNITHVHKLATFTADGLIMD